MEVAANISHFSISVALF